MSNLTVSISPVQAMSVVIGAADTPASVIATDKAAQAVAAAADTAIKAGEVEIAAAATVIKAGEVEIAAAATVIKAGEASASADAAAASAAEAAAAATGTSPVGVDFTALPDPAANDGRVMRCNPLVAGQGYFYMVSDGTFWRPYGGCQPLYRLAAPVQMAVNTSAQILAQIPIPPKLIPDGRAYIKSIAGADKLGGTSDTLTLHQRFGPNGSSADTGLFSASLSGSNVSVGIVNMASRVSPTTVRKHGKGNTFDTLSFGGTSTTGRQAAFTVGNMDTTLNYLTVFGIMSTGTVEYGQLHAFTVELMG